MKDFKLFEGFCGDFCPPHQLRFCTFQGWLVERTRAGWMFRESSLFILYTLYLKDSLSINIAYNNDPGWFEIVNNSMVEYLANIIEGEATNIASDFEILEIFFKSYVIAVNWIDCNYTWGWYDDETGRWTGAVGKVNMNTFLLE